MKKIGVFTHGADAPGMNAALRAIYRICHAHKVELVGIRNGLAGLTEADFVPFDRTMSANIINRGGTILHTSNFTEFENSELRHKAVVNLEHAGIQGVIGIGDATTMKVLSQLAREHSVHTVGIPATIDNDLYGSDFTIGFDTAINTAAEAIDRIRDTADSSGRVYAVEVMGSESGFLATYVGIACGADYIAIPETLTNVHDLFHKITHANRRFIIVIGEGDEVGGAAELSKLMKEAFNLDMRVVVLGHLQRGGTPTVRDRVLASRLGNAAVETLLSGASNVMVGELNSEIHHTPLQMTYEKRKGLNDQLVRLAEILE